MSSANSRPVPPPLLVQCFEHALCDSRSCMPMAPGNLLRSACKARLLAAQAERMWKRHLEQDDSPMTDLFGGQLQGNITCHGCKGRFTRYEFFKVGAPCWHGLSAAELRMFQCAADVALLLAA